MCFSLCKVYTKEVIWLLFVAKAESAVAHRLPVLGFKWDPNLKGLSFHLIYTYIHTHTHTHFTLKSCYNTFQYSTNLWVTWHDHRSQFLIICFGPIFVHGIFCLYCQHCEPKTPSEWCLVCAILTIDDILNTQQGYIMPSND